MSMTEATDSNIENDMIVVFYKRCGGIFFFHNKQ